VVRRERFLAVIPLMPSSTLSMSALTALSRAICGRTSILVYDGNSPRAFKFVDFYVAVSERTFTLVGERSLIGVRFLPRAQLLDNPAITLNPVRYTPKKIARKRTGPVVTRTGLAGSEIKPTLILKHRSRNESSSIKV